MTKREVSGYDLLRLIGRGAHSEIYCAMSKSTGKTVAVKVVRTERSDQHKFIDQVRNEYKIGSSLEHPNVVRMFDLTFVRRFLRVTGANLIMEYIDGPDLERKRHYPVAELLQFYMQVSMGLQYLHEQGLIHTDIKPNNIVIHKGQTAKIIDLGIARACGMPTGRVQGTVQYIAPEQMLRQRLDERTDVYNLGAAFYYVFRGEFLPAPLLPAALGGVGAYKAQREPVGVRRANPDVPEPVDDLIRRSCLPEPGQRPQSMREVIEVLTPFVGAQQPSPIATDPR